jgi:hypothetical protein
MADSVPESLRGVRSLALPRLGARAARASAAAGLTILAVALAILVGPGIRATGTPADVGTLELGTSAPVDGAIARGEVDENENGYLVDAGGTARVTLPLHLPARTGTRTLLRLWAYGTPRYVTTTLVLVSGDGTRRTLGRAGTWAPKTFDVTAEARRGAARLQATSTNRLVGPALFLDRVAPVAMPESALATASTWSVALLVLVLAAAVLAVAGRLRRHWPLAPALALAAALGWHRVAGAGLEALPLGSATSWSYAGAASWLGFHDGLLWGSWSGVSSLAVQVYHAFRPIVGDAPAAARSGSLLALLLALAAVYALGHRAAGRRGAVAATLVALAASPLRDAAVDGGALPVLVLAGALLGYALHACAANVAPGSAALLGLALAVIALAEPLWLPGAVLALPVVVLAAGERGRRAGALGAGVLVLALALAPHLAATAAQNDGDALAAVTTRAVAARNQEFAGKGHGAPTALEQLRDPYGGRPVTLGGYVFGDHSGGQLMGGALTGAREALAAFARGSALAVAAFVLAALGLLYVVLLRRLRLLVLVPALVALPALFVAGRTPADAFSAGAVLWPALPASAAILVYAASELARARWGRRR